MKKSMIWAQVAAFASVSLFAGGGDVQGSESDVAFVSNGGVFKGVNFGDMEGSSGTAQLTLAYGKGRYNSGMRAEKSGSAFEGWWTAASGGTPQYDANGACIPGEGCWSMDNLWTHLGNAKFYARFGGPHQLTFHSNGGMLSGVNFGNMDGKIGVVQIPVVCGMASYCAGMRAKLDGSRFLGWWTSKNGGSMQYDENGRFVPGSTCWTANGRWRCHASPLLYARWEADEPHTLKFDPNGGVLSGANFGSMEGKSSVAQVSVTCGKGSYNAGMRATRDGYTFQGWWTAASGGSMQYDVNGRFVPDTTCWDVNGKWKVHGNTTLYARWQ